MLNRARSCWVAGLVLLLFTVARNTGAELPWEGNAFAGNPKAILTAAEKLAAGNTKDTIVLLEEERIVLDEASRITDTRRVLYRVGMSDSEGWSNVTAVWKPWRQQKPNVRVRVISPDGKTSQLDQNTLAESPLGEDSDTFGDSRLLRAPLPALTPGAVVETLIVVKDNEPSFSRGVAEYLTVGNSARTLRTLITLEAPSSLPLKYSTYLLPDVKPAKSTAGSKVKVTFEIGPVDKPDYEAYFAALDGEHWRPYVAFSTAASWNAVAEGFSRIVDTQIARSSVSAVAREIASGATGRAEIIDRVTQKVQKAVHYKAVELGDSAIVPTPPAETLRLEYGDCKDQAGLAVALLRENGIESYVALLAVASNNPNPDLPGFGAFDHAIVYIPAAAASPATWIDTTPGFGRAGQLPKQDQNRLALVAKPGTSDLIRIPEFKSRAIQTFDIQLSEQGGSQIVSTEEYFGARELEIRARFGNQAREDTEKSLASVMKNAMAAKSADQIRYTDPSDYSAPFKLSYRVSESRIGFTGKGDAAVLIGVDEIVGSVQSFAEDRGRFLDKDDDAPKKMKKELPRELSEEVTEEQHYHVVPPPGFRPASVPKNKTERWGPATLSWEFKVSPEGFVDVDLRFDTGAKRFTATEVAEVRKGLESLEKADRLILTFDQIGESLLAEEKVLEALKEFRKLAALHPKEAIHHSQIAEALLAAGLGELARREAQLAVQLEPNSALAQQTLGEVMEHDLVGVRFKPGWDRSAAEMAYRKALELNPDDGESALDLAILLEHNAQGERYGNGADLAKAIEVYKEADGKSVKTAAGRSALQDNLSLALMWTGRFEEAKESATRMHVKVAAIAATEGIDAAQREAGKVADPSSRQSTLVQGSILLMQLRLYEPAAALMRAGARGAANASQILTQADRLSRIKRYEAVSLSPATPGDTMKRIVSRLVAGADDEELLSFVVKDNRENSDVARVRASMAVAKSGARVLSNTATIGVDSLMALISITAEGDDQSGYFLTMKSDESIIPEQTGFMVREDGEYRVLALGDETQALGKLVLQRMDAGDQPGARKLLDWARKKVEEIDAIKDKTTLTAELPELTAAQATFLKVWGLGSNEPATMRLAAASLLSSKGPDKSLSILIAGLDAATDPAVRFQLQVTIAYTLQAAGRTEESLAAARRAVEQQPNSETAQKLVFGALARLKKYDELKNMLGQRMKNEGQTEDQKSETLRQLAGVEMMAGNLTGAEVALKQVIGSSKATSGDFNSLAWLMPFHDKVTDADVSIGLRAVALSPQSPPSLHTLATLYAEVGKTSEARQLLLQAMELWGHDTPGPQEWYVFGRIYEHFGEPEAAIAAYKHLDFPAGTDTSPVSTIVLAQRRLRALGQ